MSTPPPQRRKKLSRRALVIGGSVAGCCVIVPTAAVGTIAVRAVIGPDSRSNVGDLDFQNPLAIPPLADSTINEQGQKVFDLTLQTGETDIVPNGTTSTWGVNGPFLGPTLRATRGDKVAFTLRNELPEETTIHWHGMHLPAAMDGGPHQTIPAGKEWNPYWTIDQPAATLWYHPHPHGKTADHVYHGIAGLFLLDDDESASLQLPDEYGVDDIPLIIQDKNVKDNGEFDFSPASFLDSLSGAGNFGILGDKILVNGTYNPHLDVTRTRMRFRLLNGSNARFYNIGFSDDRPFHLIATDNGLVSGEPPELTRLLLGPAERAEIVVEFAPGDEVVLHSFKQDLSSPGVNTRQIGGNDTFDLLQLRAGDRLDPAPPLPTMLRSDGGAPAVPADATKRSFTLNGHSSINDEKMDMNRIDLVIPANALEIWDVESESNPHTFHIHGSTFHVLDVNGEAPPPDLQGPKDTVLVSKDHKVRLAVQFASYTDPEMPYMYHCHILRHEDNGMMGQFVVVEPGTEDSVPRTISGHMHH